MEKAVTFTKNMQSLMTSKSFIENTLTGFTVFAFHWG